MKPLHEIINMLKWHPGFDTNKAYLTYRDRVSDASAQVNCASIIAASKREIQITTPLGSINLPAHRVTKVVYDGIDVLYQRELR